MTFRMTTPIIACLGLVFSLGPVACRTEPVVPTKVFAPWDGTWVGRFYVKDGAGNTLTALQVRQEYRSDGPRCQFGYFREVDLATGAITTATATNSHDGRSMRCEVTKRSTSGGKVTEERVVHRGRWTGEAIEWRRSTPEARELFLERVSTSTDGETYYDIRGWGEYGGGARLHFEGRYRKQ